MAAVIAGQDVEQHAVIDLKARDQRFWLRLLKIEQRSGIPWLVTALRRWTKA
jgi:hypothetical protein